MSKKEKNEIKLSSSVKMALENFCRASGRDITEFVEEAIIEKIEFDEADKSLMLLDGADAPADAEELILREQEDEGFKRKH